MRRRLEFRQHLGRDREIEAGGKAQPNNVVQMRDKRLSDKDLTALTLLFGAANQSCCYFSQAHSSDACTTMTDGDHEAWKKS